MTVDEDFTENTKKNKTKNVLVGIRMDGNDRLLLNWTLVKVAEPGDHIVALHVCRDLTSDEKKNHSLLDNYLEVYKGLCNAKQLDLIGKVSRGKSIRKVLVREARLCKAMIVVVGINNQNAICGWVSVANYCAKRLPPTTTVLTVHNGKIIFQRGFINHLPGLKGDWMQSIYPIQPQGLKVNRPGSIVSEVPMLESSEIQAGHGGGDETKQDTFRDYRCKEETSPSSKSGADNSIHDDSSSPKSVDELLKEIREPVPGWPLLKRASSLNPGYMKESALARKMSVVQWAMSLPKRPMNETETELGSDETEVLLEKEIVSMSRKSCMSIKGIQNSLSAWGDLPKELELLLNTNSSRCRWFVHKELSEATAHFSSGNLIAKGGCSSVYKGCLLDGKKVAIKIMKMSKEAWKDYTLEIDIISSLKHKHIIPLLGVCLDNNELILVYDFLSNGSLEENLHGTNEGCGLSWEVRFNVAVGVAEAINYLHRECPRPVIHRDIKSSNILLSDEFEPQISDFGLAVRTSSSASEIHSDVVGTFGYLAPEYFMYGKVSAKIDVYSFGVVLLELLSGKKPISSGTLKGQESLVMWAKPILESGDIKRLLDSNLLGKMNEIQMQRVVLAANLCITRTARLRPEMDQILKLLRGEMGIKEWLEFHGEDQEEVENQNDDEVYPDSCAQSHIDVAFHDVDGDDDDEVTSFSSVDQPHHTFEDYLKERYSRSSSFD